MSQSFSNWYAIQARARYEKTTAFLLEQKGYEAFLPLYTSRNRWSDRVKEVELPLFSGYLFCRFNARERLPILTTPGVLGVVGSGNVPIPVEDDEIEAIRLVLETGLPVMAWPSLQVGQTVYISEGPLTGVEGVVTQIKGRFRLIVSVTLLQRAVAVEIDREWAEPTAPARLARGPASLDRLSPPPRTTGSLASSAS
jgi:transcription antitermination factor NusG